MTKQEFIKITEKRLFPILYNLMRQYDTLSFLQDFGMYLRTEIEKTYKCAERVGFKEYLAKKISSLTTPLTLQRMTKNVLNITIRLVI